VQPPQPDRVERGTRGFEQIHYLYRRAQVFGRKLRRGRKLAKAAYRFYIVDVGEYRIQAGKIVQQIVPSGNGLVFDAVQRALPRPSGGN